MRCDDDFDVAIAVVSLMITAVIELVAEKKKDSGSTSRERTREFWERGGSSGLR